MLSVLPMFSSKNFTVSGHTFRSLNHFEFIFVYGIRKCSNFILLHVVVQFSQHHLLKRLSLPLCIFLPPLSEIRYPQVHGFISLLSIFFHWSTFLFLCQYHTVLMTVALQYNLKSCKLIIHFQKHMTMKTQLKTQNKKFHSSYGKTKDPKQPKQS